MNKKHFVLGGDIKKSLTEGYQLDFKTLFKDAFVITKKHFLPLLVACLFTVIIVAVSYGLIFDDTNGSETSQMVINFIFTSVVMTPLVTGLQMMGVHHSIGVKSKSIDVFNYFNKILPLALASLIINLLVYGINVGLTQALGDSAVVPSLIILLYLNMAFCLVYPLIAEKQVEPVLALKLSLKLVNKNLRQFTLLFMILGLIGIVSLLPYGLGLFVFIPFYFNLMGIIYRQMCGVGVVASINDSDDDDNNHNDNNDEFEA
ncbi:hypothetical protein [Psychromonas ossibalaenae]|uniref:hypothetical protein n=1 Tax=Psychromonas ossibalaenae TaxID=444922 RepID=UPI00036FC6D2|nr:hypothetical protein [Psychromonas ossibalaenae]